MADWQPIETAPKDGTLILGFGQWAGEISGIDSTPGRCLIYWCSPHTDYPGFEWKVTGGDAYASWMKPTHWMPIPEPPEGQ